MQQEKEELKGYAHALKQEIFDLKSQFESYAAEKDAEILISLYDRKVIDKEGNLL